MKKNLIFLICLIISIISTMVFGQNETKQINVDVDEVKVTPPKFTGVQEATFIDVEKTSLISKYLAENFNCPQKTAEREKEGTEVIQFTVTPEGKLTNFEVINSVCMEVDKELIRILKTTTGMWKPGYNNGEPTAMEQEVSMMIGDYRRDKMINHFVTQAEKYFTLGTTTLLVEHKPKKALGFFNKGVRYLPADMGLLMLRGMCNYKVGNEESARKDWNRIVALGGTANEVNHIELDGMSGYSEMINILARNKDN